MIDLDAAILARLDTMPRTERPADGTLTAEQRAWATGVMEAVGPAIVNEAFRPPWWHRLRVWVRWRPYVWLNIGGPPGGAG